MRRVVGLGQPAAGDDGVGLAVLDALEAEAFDDVELVRLRDAAPLVDLLDGQPLLLVDAVVGGGEPGTLRWLGVDALARAPLWSTHGLSVAEAVGLATALHGAQVAAGLRILGVCIDPPSGPAFTLSPAVAAAVPLAAQAVHGHLAR